MSGAKFSGGRLHPQHLCPHSCTWAHAHVCTHSLTNTQSSRAIYFPQDLRREHNYSAPKLSHGTVLELYCRNVVTTHTQPRKWWARLRIPSKAISTLVAKPTMISSCTHGSIYVFSQAWVDMKVICQEFRSSDICTYTHTSATGLSIERGTSCGWSQNSTLEGKAVIGIAPLVTATTLF